MTNFNAMSESPDHFAAYSFVDRIDAFEPGRAAHATFAVPPNLARFPACLLAEAVGQLAAWVSMEHIDFRGRPVAALASETRFAGDAHPGAMLDLSVTVDHCDDETVAYGGEARSNGRRLIELVDCLGPMLPAAEFDDPDALRARFALLRNGGAAPGRFRGVDPVEVITRERIAGVSLRARLDVPHSAPFFNDHFPRRPVFPATLLLDTQIDLALGLARDAQWAAGRVVTPHRSTHVKMRSFITPGQALDLAIDVKPPVDGIARATLQAATEGRTVAGARLEMQVSHGS
jgi:3-hydroxymyristoyl/3-hydroxydecanoyl-(acyl carrier protein) dehydratase